MRISEIEALVRNKTENAAVSHGFGHLRRTAIGARWFSKMLGGTPEHQRIAYIAGLVHDFSRPLTERTDHAGKSVSEAGKFLSKLDFDKDMINSILRMVEIHREAGAVPLPDQCVFLSDKIFEQMGAYATIRRCMYVGECKDYKGMDPVESIIAQFSARMKKFSPESFDKKFISLVKYQYGWPLSFFEAFKHSEKWAMDFSRYFYECGKRRTTMEKSIRGYCPLNIIGKSFIMEAISYVNSRKYDFFRTVLKDR